MQIHRLGLTKMAFGLLQIPVILLFIAQLPIFIMNKAGKVFPIRNTQ